MNIKVAAFTVSEKSIKTEVREYQRAIVVTSGAIYRQLLLLHLNVMMININKCDHVEKKHIMFSL